MLKKGIFTTDDVITILLTTHQQEVFSYIKTIPEKHIAFMLVSLAVLVFVSWKQESCRQISIKLVSGSTVLVILSACMVWKHYQLGYTYQALKEIVDDKKLDSKWHMTGTIERKTFQNYVIVLGESLRTDAMSLYGNPYKTTPFLETMPYKLITNYVSTAINTSQAVPRIFALTDRKGNFSEGDNILNLAAENKMRTYWVSSQGWVGRWEVGASKIAKYADERVFTLVQDGDFKLLPVMKKILESQGRKLVVLHTIGSHEDPCGKLNDFGIVFEAGKGKFMNCYLSTVKKTDFFLKELFSMLKASNQSWTVVFFPDHAQNFIPAVDGYSVYRDSDKKQSYEIPFIEFNSDMSRQERVNISQSAYNFVQYFPTWIGIKTNLTPEGYDIFKEAEPSPRVMKYSHEMTDYSKLEDGLTMSQMLK